MLAVDDDPHALDQVALGLHHWPWRLRGARTVTEFRSAVAEEAPHVVGAFVDLALSDDRFDGVDLIAYLRGRFPGIPVVALSGRLREIALNQLTFLGADLLEKQDIVADVNRYAPRLLVAQMIDDELVRRATQVFASQFSLTYRETQIVALAALDVPRRQFHKQLGIKKATVKRHVHAAIQKTKYRRLEDIGRHLRSVVRPPHATPHRP